MDADSSGRDALYQKLIVRRNEENASLSDDAKEDDKTG